MPRLYGADEARAAERAERRRKGARRPAHVEVTITSVQGIIAPTTIRDISSYGCSVPQNTEWLKMGAFVWLRAGSDCAAVGIVRWTREKAVGVEFLRPLMPGVGLGIFIDED